MFSQQFEGELWNIWQSKPVSVLLSMPTTLTQIHKILCEEYKTQEIKLNLIINHFKNVINKNQYSIENSDESFENIINLIFNLGAVNTTHLVTIDDFLKPLADRSLTSDIKKIANCLISNIKSNTDDNLNKAIKSKNKKVDDKACDIFICCSKDDKFQYLDGFINPLLLKYNLNAIYPQDDLDMESIGLCEHYIAECKLYIAVITSNYYSDPLTSLFTRRALYYSSKVCKKIISVVMDYEPSFVAHSRYMRPIELEEAELIVYNEENISQSYDEFSALISKIKSK